MKKGLAGQQNFEVAIFSSAEFFAAWQVVANFVEWDVQIIRVIDQEQPRVGGMSKAGEIVGFNLAQTGHRDSDILGGLLELDAEFLSARGEAGTDEEIAFGLMVVVFQNWPSSLRSTRISRSFAPSLGPTMPRCSRISITRAARV